MLLLFIFSSAITISLSMDPHCPQKVAVENFNISGIGIGIWYEVARYPYPDHPERKFLTYESRMEGDLYVAKTIDPDRNSPFFTEVYSRMFPDPRGRAKMTFTLSASDRSLIESPVMYILAVDYDKYFVPYTCVYDADKNQITEHAWILSRTKPVPGKVKEEFYELSKKTGLDEDRLIWYGDDKE